MNIIKEACVETLRQCFIAQKNGAHRIELCSDLEHDGLTPSRELISQAKDILKIPIRVMIRPRRGDFVYSEEELNLMKSEIDFCKRVGVEGVVFGICTEENQLDIEAIRELTAYAKPLKVTIHKAIDICDRPVLELGRLLHVEGIDAILTSGKSRTAREGKSVIQEMINLSNSLIQIIVAGKVTDKNLKQVHQEIGAEAYHGKKIVGSLNTTEI